MVSPFFPLSWREGVRGKGTGILRSETFPLGSILLISGSIELGGLSMKFWDATRDAGTEPRPMYLPCVPNRRRSSSGSRSNPVSLSPA